MFMKLVQIALFLIVNAFGFYVVPLIANTVLKFDLIPARLAQDPYALFNAFTYYIPFSIAAALISIGFFFTKGETRAWLILAPLYIPAIFGLCVLGYYHVM
jgi:hypothetical protein